MTKANTTAEPAGDLPATAAAWDARLRSPLCGPEDQQAFEAWRDADPAHRLAFDRLQAAVRLLQESASSDPALRALRDRAVAGSRTRPAWLKIAACAAGVVLAGAGGTAAYLQFKTEPVSVYRTMAGEQSTISLADGSELMLNSKTEVRVAYRRHERAVTLVQGQAMFDVAKDQRRPFTVTAGRRSVTAVGTAFDVRLDARTVQVTMVEGRVRVAPVGNWSAPPDTQFLVAGQRMVAQNNSAETEIRVADLSRDASWRENKVIFEGETLPAALEEMNRYTETPIQIADPSLRSLQIFGMFRTNQPGGFLTALTSYYPIRAETAASGAPLRLRFRAFTLDACGFDGCGSAPSTLPLGDLLLAEG